MSNQPLHPVRDTHAVEEHVNAAWESYSSPPQPAIQLIELQEALQTATTELSMNIDDLFVILSPTAVNASSAERLELYLAVIIIRLEKIKMVRFENRTVLKKQKLLDKCAGEAVFHLERAIPELQHHMDVMVRSRRIRIRRQSTKTSNQAVQTKQKEITTYHNVLEERYKKWE